MNYSGKVLKLFRFFFVIEPPFLDFMKTGIDIEGTVVSEVAI